MEKKIKILFIKEGRFLYGAEKTILLLLKHLDRDVFDPTLLVLEYSDEDSAFTREARRLLIDTTRLRTRRGFDTAAIMFIRKFIQELGMDVVHTVGYKCDIFGNIASFGINTLITSSLHGWVCTDMKLKIYTWVDRCINLRFFNCLMPVSPELAEDISRFVSKDRISCIYNGVDLGVIDKVVPRDLRTEYDLDRNCKILICVGRIDKEKGLVYLIRALKMLKDKVRMKLFIAGEGPLRGMVENEARCLGVSGDIVFMGEVSNIFEIVKAADLFVLPSLAEGISRAAMETMALGVPVIATRVGGMAHLITDNVEGRLVEPGNSQVLAAAIEEVLVDESKRRYYVENARNKILDNFTARKVVQRFQDAILRAYNKK